MEKLQFPAFPVLLLVKMRAVCQAKDIKHERKPLESEKPVSCCLCARQQMMAGFCSRHMHRNIFMTAFLNSGDTQNGDVH
jgi:hypothetical protein